MRSTGPPGALVASVAQRGGRYFAVPAVHEAVLKHVAELGA